MTITIGAFTFQEAQGVIQPPATAAVPVSNQASTQFGAVLLPARPEPSSLLMRGMFADASTVASLRALRGTSVAIAGLPAGFVGDIFIAEIAADAVPAEANESGFELGWLVTCQLTVYPLP